MTTIEEKVIKTIYHARKSLVFDKDNVQVNKDNPEFDVTMGSHDSAELCELVGLYLLDLLTKEFGKQNIGLHRDDVSSCFENISGPDSEKIKKKLFKIFKSNRLRITVECNLIVTDILDVTFDLKSATYYPYRKLKNELLCINKHSNHPPSIIHQIPSMISHRISQNSCDKNHFNKAAPHYNIALKNSGFHQNITYIPSPFKRQTRKRQIIWFNAPYSANVKTNVGKIFMRLVDKHFPRRHKYYKLFNRNNIKLSYSCMPNINNVIRKHNSKIMKNPAPSTTKTCNCHRKADCPMDGSCLSECIIYKASVSIATNKYYYGTCENTFKEHYNNHNCSFRNKSREKNTDLPKCVWELKEKDINYSINWNIAMKSQKYVCRSRKCDLCVCQKLLISRGDPNVLLSKRDGIVSKCRHRNKFTLKCFKDR